LGLLDKAMQEDHSATCDTEYDPRYAAARQIAANFPKAFAERTAQRHSDRPRKLNVLDILANNLAVFILQCLEPFPNRLAARK
jgi:hypothetical protein